MAEGEAVVDDYENPEPEPAPRQTVEWRFRCAFCGDSDRLEPTLVHRIGEALVDDERLDKWCDGSETEPA